MIVAKNRELAGRAGAIDALVAVIRVHIDNAAVSREAISALRNVCCNNGSFKMFDVYLATKEAVLIVCVECELRS